ncbi:MAG TPA: M15 family metallopeptidase [Mycobacteriales bacterium]
MRRACDTVLGVHPGKALLALAAAAVLAGCASTAPADRPTDAAAVGPGTTASTTATAGPSGGTVRPWLDLSTYSISDPTSRWVVVNKQRPLSPLTYAPQDLASVGGGQVMRADAAAAFLQMQQAAAAADAPLYAVSGYRSYSYQSSVHDRSVERNGAAAADSSARPGYSEHQTGWAVDVGGGGCDVEACFADTAQGRWVAANSWRYGFIVRYPPGQQAITGYEYEPWHLRWVDVPLATYMHDRNIVTLEQVFGLPPAPSY